MKPNESCRHGNADPAALQAALSILERDIAMAAPNRSLRTMTGDAATTDEAEPSSSRRRDKYRPIVRLAALVSGGLLPLQCVIPMAADAQTNPPTLVAPDAAATIADRKSLSSETIIRDSLTGKAIIIVGGRGRLGSKVVRDPNGVGSLNPQPLPPDPPPNALDYFKMDLPAAVIRKPIIPRGNGVGSLNPQPLPPVSGH